MFLLLLVLGGSALVLLFIGVKYGGSNEEYCKSEHLKADLRLLGDMNICMATPACRFGIDDVRAYREALGKVNMCLEKAKIQAIPLPDPTRPWQEQAT